MTKHILLAVIIGILFGLFIVPPALASHMDIFINIGLCILLFFVGIDIGRQDKIIEKIRGLGLKILLVPVMVALGSIVGALVGGFILKLPLREAGAIGAGFGWYTLSAVELSKYNARLGALAFMANMLREVLSLIIIPLVAKYVGRLASIAPAGATSMDTTLPVISKSTDGNVAIISLVTGISLSLLAPFLMSFFMGL